MGEKRRIPVKKILFVVVVTLLVLSIIRPIVIMGTSMTPSLENNQIVWVTRWFTPVDGDIVTFKHDGQKYIKRVVAGPGDSVRIADGYLYVNGLFTDYDISVGEYESYYEMELEENQYFLLGDNSREGLDSLNFGYIQRQDILEKVVFQ